MSKLKRILITGSSGMLGVDLCRELRGGYEVWGTDVVSRVPCPVSRFLKVDITDKKSVLAVVEKIKPDIVIHTAAWTDVDGCELDPKKADRINAEGTKNVALACGKSGALPIYISTDFVFDGKKKRPYKEGDKTGPLSVYGDSKLKGEEAIKKILKKYFILRTNWLCGRNGKNFVDTIISEAESREELMVVDDQVGSPTYTKDLARAIHVLVDKVLYSVQRTAYGVRETQYGIYHISNAGSVSWYEYTKEILKLTGSMTRVIPISSKELARPAKRPAMSVLDNGKFERFTGFRMRPWKTALKDHLKG